MVVRACPLRCVHARDRLRAGALSKCLCCVLCCVCAEKALDLEDAAL